MMGAIADFLDGKKTIIAGLLVSILGGLSALGVKLPFDAPTEAAIVSGLGIIVVIARIFAKKQIVGSSPSLTPPPAK